MPRYVIDAPTLLHLIAEAVDVDPRHQLVAPGAIRSQALALLLRSVTRGELTEQQALWRLERVAEAKLRLLNGRVSRRTAWRIAREQGWDRTDAAEYLAVCRLQADALVTIDPELARLADGVVTVAPLQALLAAGTT